MSEIRQPWNDLFEQQANNESHLFDASYLAIDGLAMPFLENADLFSPTAGSEVPSQTFTQQQNANTLDLSVNTTGFGQTLARLQAYLFNVSLDSSGNVLAQLQHSLSTVGACLSDVEASSKTRGPGSNPSSSLPSSLGPAGGVSPVMAMTCSYMVQVVIACYLKMRQLHKRMVPKQSSNGSSTSAGLSNGQVLVDSALESTPIVQSYRGTTASTVAGSGAEDGSLEEASTFDSLLDHYIMRDMRLCQSFAERIMDLCRNLVWANQVCLPNRNQQPSEMSAAMETMIASLKVCTLVSL